MLVKKIYLGRTEATLHCSKIKQQTNKNIQWEFIQEERSNPLFSRDANKKLNVLRNDSNEVKRLIIKWGRRAYKHA